MPGRRDSGSCDHRIIEFSGGMACHSGRLRTKRVGLHTDEVFFRDTAHGFLSWAAALFFTLCGKAAT